LSDEIAQASETIFGSNFFYQKISISVLNISQMEGLDLIKKAFALESVERVPWVPFVGVHGGHLTDTDAATYLKSTDELVRGISKAVEEYHPDGIPVVFDLQVEAEALGCELKWSGSGPPAVVSHPLAEGTKLTDLKFPDLLRDVLPCVWKPLKYFVRNIRNWQSMD
jgi:uroporphyrinogen-III decarboxylase